MRSGRKVCTKPVGIRRVLTEIVVVNDRSSDNEIVTMMRILVVEDEERLARLISRVLTTSSGQWSWRGTSR